MFIRPVYPQMVRVFGWLAHPPERRVRRGIPWAALPARPARRESHRLPLPSGQAPPGRSARPICQFLLRQPGRPAARGQHGAERRWILRQCPPCGSPGPDSWHLLPAGQHGLPTVPLDPFCQNYRKNASKSSWPILATRRYVPRDRDLKTGNRPAARKGGADEAMTGACWTLDHSGRRYCSRAQPAGVPDVPW
jgi:hypothetical protein